MDMDIFRGLFPTRQKHPLPRVAMFMCLQNEERFLEAHLRYHHALGVSKAYVYLDRCRDASLEIARSFPWVEPIVLDDNLHTISPYYSDLFLVSAADALQKSRAEGFDWLIAFDVDEFIFADNPPAVTATGNDLTGLSAAEIRRAGYIPTMLAGVAPETEQVVMRCRELMPTNLGAAAPFWAQHYFQYKAPLPRILADPITGLNVEWLTGLGTHSGKSIVRTSADVQSSGSHRWVRQQGVVPPARPVNLPIPTEKTGQVYHFFVVSAQHWREKYQKLSREPAVWEALNIVSFFKQCFKRASVVLNDSEIEAYLDEWLFMPPEKLEACVEQGLLQKMDFVQKIVSGYTDSSLDNQRPGGRTQPVTLTLAALPPGKAPGRMPPQKTAAEPATTSQNNGMVIPNGPPAISCVCVYSNRPAQLEEAIYSFLQQDYAGQKELIIFNDRPAQTLLFDHPEVRIINLPRQFRTPMEKRNAAVALCAYNRIMIWDDDGIYLPHGLTTAMRRIEDNPGASKPEKVFIWYQGKLRIPQQNVFHSGSCWPVQLFDRIRGYSYDARVYFPGQELEARFMWLNASLAVTYPVKPEEIFYSYKWKGLPHMKDAELDIPAGPNEVINLVPHWESDYPQQVSAYLTGKQH
jgi:hypothetical protein